MKIPVNAWLVEDHEGNEVARGGSWDDGASVRIMKYRGGCGAPKPHFDGNGERDGWVKCGRVIEFTLAGTQTGRCKECRIREQERRVLRAEVPDGGGRRQTYRRTGSE